MSPKSFFDYATGCSSVPYHIPSYQLQYTIVQYTTQIQIRSKTLRKNVPSRSKSLLTMMWWYSQERKTGLWLETNTNVFLQFSKLSSKFKSIKKWINYLLGNNFSKMSPPSYFMWLCKLRQVFNKPEYSSFVFHNGSSWGALTFSRDRICPNSVWNHYVVWISYYLPTSCSLSQSKF